MILVTGATGKVGSAVLQRLRAAGHAVTAALRGPAADARLTDAAIPVVTGDFDDPACWDTALVGIDALFLVTPSDDRQVARHRTVLAAAQRAGVGRIVRLSGAGACIGSPAVLRDWHGQCDSMAMTSGIPCTVLRPNYFMQNWLGRAPAILRDGGFPMPEGAMAGRYALIDVEDIAEAAVAVLTAPSPVPGPILLNGPERFSHAEIAQAIGEVADRAVVVQVLDRAAFQARLVAGGASPWYAAMITVLYEIMPPDPQDDASLRALIARPPADFQGFLRRHAAAFRPG